MTHVFHLQDSVPLSMLLMGDKSETAPNALAQRLGSYMNVFLPNVQCGKLLGFYKGG